MRVAVAPLPVWSLLLAAYGENQVLPVANLDLQKQPQTQLIKAESGEVI